MENEETNMIVENVKIDKNNFGGGSHSRGVTSIT